MKKFTALFLSMLILLSFSGCAQFNIVSIFKNEPDWENITIAELSTGSPFKYYYNQLGNKEKQAYNNVLQKVETLPNSIEIPSLSKTELSTVFEALLYDNPLLFCLGRTCNITTRGLHSYFNAVYIMSASEYSQKKQRLVDKAAKIIASFGKSGSDSKTELNIHNYIVNNCSYENSGEENESSAYGALIDKKASCEGYSKAAKVLLDLAGIDCYVISGMSKNYSGELESHMWDIVNINSNFYHLDVTWDDPISLSKNKSNEPRYMYFNVTDKEISKTHSDFHSVNPCIATAENYYVKNGLYFTEYNEETRKQMAKALAAEVNAGGKKIEIKFSSSAVYNQAFKGLFKKEQIYRILAVASLASKKDISKRSVSYIQNDDFNIIELIVDLA